MSMPLSKPSFAWQELATFIEHTNLRPEATADQITLLCEEAIEFGFRAVVVNPCYVALAASRLQASDVKVATVVGFPLGATLSRVKEFEASEAIRCGAQEIDMVLNIGALKSGNLDLVEMDIRSVAAITARQQGLLKVILETSLLTGQEKEAGCELSVRAGADFVKTSTGFLGGGAAVEDISLMRHVVGPRIGVKASGGIKTLAHAMSMIEAGANRLGTSSGVSIIRERREYPDA